MKAVPLPWWTSRSITATRSTPRDCSTPDRHGDVVEGAEAFAVIQESA